MSLIQDALKRQQRENEESGFEEAGGESGMGQEVSRGGGVDGPCAIEKSGSEKAAEGERFISSETGTDAGKHPGSATWRAVLGVILLLVIAFGAAVYVISLAVSRFEAERRAGEAPPGEQDEYTLVSLSEAERDDVSDTRDLAPEGERLPSEKSVPPDPLPEPVRARPERVPEPELFSREAQQGLRKPLAPDDEISAEPDVTERLQQVHWPRLKLTGVFVGLGEGQNSARINGKLVSEGGMIDGVTLKSVRAEGVVLTLEHETRFLRMGGL